MFRVIIFLFPEKRRPRIHEKPFSQVKPVFQVKLI